MARYLKFVTIASSILVTIVSLFIGGLYLPPIVHAASQPHPIKANIGNIHVEKTIQAAQRDAQAQSSLPVIYHNGPVMQHTSTTYAIFWEPPTLPDGSTAYVSPFYNTLLDRYFGDVGGSPLYNNNIQYYDNFSGHIINSSTFGGFWTDVTRSYPLLQYCTDSYTPHDCLLDLDIQAEVRRALRANPNWTVGLNSIFFVFTAEGEGSCITRASTECAFGNGYCAYHSSFNLTKSGPVVFYANMPYEDTDPSDCGIQPYTSKSPNNDFDSDSEINAVSHEQMESVTDPYGPQNDSGWFDANKNEIADKCRTSFGAPQSKYNGGDVQWHGHNYFIQEEWSNYINSKGAYTGCTLRASNEALTQTIYTTASVGYEEDNVYAYATSDGSNANGTPRWVYACKCITSGFLAFDAQIGLVYFVNISTNSLVALSAVNGVPNGVQFPNNGNNIGLFESWSPPVIDNGNVYISTNQGIFAFDKNGNILWSNTAFHPEVFPLLLANGVLYVAGLNGSTIYGVDESTGAITWQFTLPSGGFLSTDHDLTYANGVLYFGINNSTNTVDALNIANSSLNWSVTVPQPLYFAPTVSGNGVYFTAANSSNQYDDVYGLNIANGSPLWPPIQMSGSSGAKVVVGGSALYVGEEAIYSINATTGAINWITSGNYDYGGFIPAVLDGELFITGNGTINVYNTNKGTYRMATEGNSYTFILPNPNSF